MQKGFSLVEMLIVAGLLSGAALVSSTIVKSMHQGQATAEAKMEELEIRRVVSSVLMDKNACANTFSGVPIGSSVLTIKNGSGGVLFQAGSVYGNNSIKLESMSTQDLGQAFSNGTRMINLVLNIKKMKQIIRQTSVPVGIKLKVSAASATSVITSCSTEADQYAQVSCESAGGVWINSACSYDAQYVKKSGDSMTGNLMTMDFQATNGNFTSSITTAVLSVSNKITSSFFCTGSNCKKMDDLALANQACPFGQVQSGVTSTGTPICVPLQCPTNQFFAGIDSSGNTLCRPYPTNTCPTNQFVSSVNANGTVNCSVLPSSANSTCPTGQVLQSISGGAVTCVNRGAGSSCGAGQLVLGVQSDGSLICGTEPDKICPVGQVLQTISNGSYICVKHVLGSVCSTGKVVTSINVDGTLNCVSAVVAKTCMAGTVVTAIKEDGTVTCESVGGGSAEPKIYSGSTCPSGKYIIATFGLKKTCNGGPGSCSTSCTIPEGWGDGTCTYMSNYYSSCSYATTSTCTRVPTKVFCD